MPSDKKPTGKPGETEFQRFESLARRLLRVPKRDIQEKDKATEPKRKKA